MPRFHPQIDEPVDRSQAASQCTTISRLRKRAFPRSIERGLIEALHGTAPVSCLRAVSAFDRTRPH